MGALCQVPLRLLGGTQKEFDLKMTCRCELTNNYL